MTRTELREWFDEAQWFCGCGDPEDAAGVLLKLLEIHPLYDAANQKLLQDDFPNNGVRFFVLYTLDHFGLTEHGGIVSGGWLTDKGKGVRDALRLVVDGEGLEAFFDES